MKKMNEKQTKKISKFLSLILRHKPESVGVQLDANGWTDIDTLLQKMNQSGTQINRNQLDHVVATNNKKRFAVSPCNSKIRANQGHSVDVDLAYRAASPPDQLFHGTPEHVLPLIRRSGLKKMQRHHVHMNAAADPCVHVAARYGKPVVLEINAKQMHGDGYEFFISDNDVWLTDHVPPQYIRFPEQSSQPSK